MTQLNKLGASVLLQKEDRNANVGYEISPSRTTQSIDSEHYATFGSIGSMRGSN
jgi:hypothetical protein